MGVFEEADGHSLKFFIQKGLPEDEQATLIQTIEDEGGKIESKVPIKGYILIQPNTTEAERLRECWLKPDRPERHFVPLSWIGASKEYGKALRQVFLKNNKTLKIHIHKSIANINTRSLITSQIYHSGGDPTESEEEADVILADPETDIFKQLVKKYQADSNKHIESHTWINSCIDRGICVHSASTYKNPGGRRAGDERTAFSDEDEINLCQWIATVIPYKESGGRTGNKIYQELCSHANMPGYEWVSRHTWQSWRERYKKNAARLDEHIAAIVESQQSLKAVKTQYAYVKQLEPKPKRKRRTKKELAEAAAQDAQIAAGGSNLMVNSEGLGSESEGEWAIRVGSEATPNWGKRKRDDHTAAEAMKRMKSGGYESVPQNTNGDRVHLVDQALQEIADEFQFLVTEVRTFYDKTGDMNATRDRFQRMREVLTTMAE